MKPDRSFDINSVLQDADVLIMPSAYEGFGIAAIKAAKLETYVIGYDVVGLKDSILDGKTGRY